MSADRDQVLDHPGFDLFRIPNNTNYRGDDILSDGSASFGDLDNCTNFSKCDPDVDTDVYVVPDLLQGGDYSGGSYTKANHKKFLEDFGSVRGVVDLSGGHGSYGVAINTKEVPLNHELWEVLSGLIDYPIIDDEAVIEMEMEGQSESWESWGKHDFLKEIAKQFGLTDEEEEKLDNLDDGKIYEIFREAQDKSNTEWQEESGGGWYIDMKRLVGDGIEISERDPESRLPEFLLDAVPAAPTGPAPLSSYGHTPSSRGYGIHKKMSKEEYEKMIRDTLGDSYLQPNPPVAYNPINWEKFPDVNADVIDFVESIEDPALKGRVFNLVRKQPMITLTELQGLSGGLVPKKREPTAGEKFVAENVVRSLFADHAQIGDRTYTAWRTWVEVILMKHRVKEYTVGPGEGDRFDPKEYMYYFPDANFPEDGLLLFNFGSANRLHLSNAGENFKVLVRRIFDWAIDERAEIHNYDWVTALAESERWHEECKLLSPGGRYRKTDPENIVKEYEDGWTMQKITNEHDLEVEGSKMGHCVGGGGYWRAVERGDAEIYSLRDPKNEPHVTIELAGKDNLEVIQIQGKEDKRPIAEYRERVAEWFDSEKSDAYQALGEVRSITHELWENSDELESLPYPIWNWLQYKADGGVGEPFDRDETYGFQLVDKYEGDSWKDCLDVIEDKYHHWLEWVNDPKPSTYVSEFRKREVMPWDEIAKALIALAKSEDDEKEPGFPNNNRFNSRGLAEAAFHDMLELFGRALPYFNQDFSKILSGVWIVQQLELNPGATFEHLFQEETGFRPSVFWDEESYLRAYWNWMMECLDEDGDHTEQFTKQIIFKKILEELGFPITVPPVIMDAKGQLRLQDEFGESFNPRRRR